MKNKSLLSLFFSLLAIILILNVLYSQNLPGLYFNLINEDQNAVVSFLKKIKKHPDFNKQLNNYKRIYGDEIENKVFAQDRQRKKEIEYLTELLQKNPKSTDILYSLYLLEKEEGNDVKAEGYLKKAKAVDPMVEKYYYK